MESLPGDSLRIGRPILVGARIAAFRILLIESRQLCRGYLLTQSDQLGLRVHLDAKMIYPTFDASAGDGEVNARILQHPFGVVWLQHCRRQSEHSRVKLHTHIEIVYRYVHVKTFHDRLLFPLIFDLNGGQQRPSAVSTTLTHSCGIPWQQFWVRNVISAAMRSKSTA